jgi:hypothetical protein
MHPARIAFMLGHRDARMVERVYGVLDMHSVGQEVGVVFRALNLPHVQPIVSLATGDNRGTKPVQRVRPMRKLRSPELLESQELAVPRDGIEPPTRGFSGLAVKAERPRLRLVFPRGRAGR